MCAARLRKVCRQHVRPMPPLPCYASLRKEVKRMTNDKLIEYTVEITKAAIANAGEKAPHIVNYPEDLGQFMTAVHSKLVELDKAQQ